jgi:hypothetical protein
MREDDPVLAALVDEAVDALRIAGDSLGPPLVVPLDEWPVRTGPRPDLDKMYQRTLENLTMVRRSVADVATSRKRVELQIEQLERRLDSLEDQHGVPGDRDRYAAVAGQLASLREEYDGLRGEEERVTLASMRLQAKVDAFRTRKEATKARWTVAEGVARADQAIELAEAELDEAIAAAGGTRPASGRQAGGRPAGGPRPEPQSRALELYELRPGAPGKFCARILFALDDRSPDREVEPDWTAFLLAAGTVEDWLRAWYQDAELLCRARYRRTQFPGEQSQSQGAQSQGAQSTPDENAG